jgi:hypothetical protein
MQTTRAALDNLEGHLRALLDLLQRNISELSPESIARATLECIQVDCITPALEDLQNLTVALAHEEAASNGRAPGADRAS